MSELVPKKVDGRSVPFLNNNKPKAIEEFLNGEMSLREFKESGALKLTNKEKAALVRMPEFLELLDVALFDAAFGLRDLTKGQQEAIKTLMRRLDNINNLKGTGTVEVKTRGRVGAMQIQVVDPEAMISRQKTDETIRKVREAAERNEALMAKQQEERDRYYRKLREQDDSEDGE